MEALFGARRRRVNFVVAPHLLALLLLVGLALPRAGQRGGCYNDPKLAAQLHVQTQGEGIVFSSNRLDGMLAKSGSIQCESNLAGSPYPRPECQESIGGTYDHAKCPCDASWDGAVPGGGEVVLTADAEPLWRFDHWEDLPGKSSCQSGASTSPRITVKLPTPSNVGCRAVFVLDPIGLPASITTVEPSSAAVGETVVIKGQNLDPSSLITFNGVDAELTAGSTTELVTKVPDGATSGPLDVVGSTGVLEYPAFAIPGGTDPPDLSSDGSTDLGSDLPTSTDLGQPSDASTVPDGSIVFKPTITSFSPMTGPWGTQVTVIGTNFTYASRVELGQFYPDALPGDVTFVVDSDTQLHFTVPTNTMHSEIRVFNAAGWAQAAQYFLPDPVILSVDNACAAENQGIPLHGVSFSGALKAWINGTQVSLVVVTDVLMYVYVPTPAPSSGPIEIESYGLKATAPVNYCP